jgi:hypothetical protein
MEDSSNNVGTFGPYESSFLPASGVTDDRKRNELDGLLRMAEELQEGLESASQRFLTNSLFLFVMILVGLAGGITVAFLVTDVRYQIVAGVLIAIFLGTTALVLARNQAKFQLHRRRDRNALNEVLNILQEVEPVIRATSDWSRLDEAAFRIRLSRFGVGRYAGSTALPVDRGMDRFTRTMRFLLDDKNAHYRQFVEKAFRNIDVAVKNLMEATNFDDVLRRAGTRLEIVDDEAKFKALVDSATSGMNTMTRRSGGVSTTLTGGQWGGARSYAIFDDGRIVLNMAAKRDFDACQQQLRIQLGETN